MNKMRYRVAGMLWIISLLSWIILIWQHFSLNSDGGLNLWFIPAFLPIAFLIPIELA